MPRPYHSASSDSLGRRCARAWAYAYIAGIREPRVTWAEIEAGAPATSRQKASALGVAVHAQLEAWYARPAALTWESRPAQIALSGLHLLPHPDRCTARVEAPIGAVPLDSTEPHAPKVALYYDGVAWAGYRDLVVTDAGAELERLGLIYASEALVDHKSSSNISAYALTPAGLADDFQANLYAYATMIDLGADEIWARWVYYETRATRRSHAVEAHIFRDAAEAKVAAATLRAKALDRFVTVDDAPMNVLACSDYGGCPHHHSVGGPCSARRSLGAMIAAQHPKKRIVTMSLSPDIKAKFAALTAPPVAAVADTEPPPPAPAEAEAPAKAPRGRPRKVDAPFEIVTRDVGPKSLTVKGKFGPLTVSGDPADVIEAIRAFV